MIYFVLLTNSKKGHFKIIFFKLLKVKLHNCTIQNVNKKPI